MVHSGGHQFHQLISWIDHSPDNLYFDTSAIQNIFYNSPYISNLNWFLNKIPKGRLFWGSDYPDYTFEEALKAFNQLNFNDVKKNNFFIII